MATRRLVTFLFLAVAPFLTAHRASAGIEGWIPDAAKTDTTRTDPKCPPPPLICGLLVTASLPDDCTPPDTLWSFSDSIAAEPNVSGALVSPAMRVLPATSGLFTIWDQFLDAPRGSGYVQRTEYRFYRGVWSAWRNADPNATVRMGRDQYWTQGLDLLTEAAQAESVQVQWEMVCVPSLAQDGANCSQSVGGIAFRDFAICRITLIPPLPFFRIRPVSMPQSTFVSGTIGGTNCNPATVTAGACWPGVRGSDAGTGAIHDNVNSPIGDSIVVAIQSPLRSKGMGVNWHFGYDKSVGGGLTISRTNNSYNASFDVPRVIYRLFDPATKTWSPFDSSALDADAVVVGAGDTTLAGSGFRMVWPPRDRVGSSLPGGFSINGHTLYSQLAFLPRGTRLQYYFKAVDITGNAVYQFTTDDASHEVEDLPTLPGSAVLAPDILEFDVLPRVYPAGAGGTQLAGRTTTPLLAIDGGYGAWFYGADPVTEALRALGVRADRYRVLQGTDYGNNVGGHELSPPVFGPGTNHFPNMNEYAIEDSLSAWYRLVIVSGDLRNDQWISEADAKLLHAWWNHSTGTDGGDRCLFVSGNDVFNSLMNQPSGLSGPEQASLGTNVLGAATAAKAWSGSTSNVQPLMDDKFLGTGPSLGVSGVAYPTENGCPTPKQFDGLTKAGGATGVGITYPGSAQAASIANMQEQDVIADHDRNKSLAYAFSLEYIRQGGMDLVDTRAQVLYRFLTGCRAARVGGDTTACWPCAADANKYGNWAALSGFQTGTYGPLYLLQDATRALSGVQEPGAPRANNRILQNRPNPFNPVTQIPFEVARAGNVTVVVLDIQGRRVRTIVDGFQTAGPHVATWDGSLEGGGRAASGVYFYRVRFADGSAAQLKMVLLR